MPREPLPTLPDVPCADVLVATVDASLRDEVAMRLWADGRRVREIVDEEELFDVLSEQANEHPSLVVADVRFSGPGVRTLLSMLRQAGIPVVYVGADHDADRPRGSVVFRSEAPPEEVYRLAARFLEH